VGWVAAWVGPGWAEVDFAANAAALAMPSAVSTSRQELMVQSFRSSVEDQHKEGVAAAAICAAARL
jgi:hypothetical protein